MRAAFIAAACAALLVAVSISAQDKPEPAVKPPFEFNCTGDTVDNFKVTMVVNQKVDQSTARGVVEAYLGFDDGRSNTSKSFLDARARWDELTLKELTALEAKLLAPETCKAAESARKAESAKRLEKHRDARAAEVAAETKAEDGTVVIETVQKFTDGTPDKTGKINEHTGEEKQRFTCAKGKDGKWRISKMERWTPHLDRETEEWVSAWMDNSLSLGGMLALTDERLDKRAEFKQDTPENAALSLYNALLPRKFEYLVRFLKLMLSDRNKHMEALVSPELASDARNAIKRQTEKYAKQVPESALAAEPAVDGKDGTKIVKYKKSREWLPDVQVTLKQVDGKWMVVEAGVWETKSGTDDGPKYRAIEDVYELPGP